MVEARRDHCEYLDTLAWNHTFALLAGLHNTFGDEQTRPIDPMRFCPYVGRQRKGRVRGPTDQERQILRQAFPGKTN